MKRRLISILLVVSMALSLPGLAFAQSANAGKQVPFTDVSTTAWYYDEVLWAYEEGIVEGVGGNRFAPDEATTRAMLVTMLWRLEGQPIVLSASKFTDVNTGSWYEDAVNWAAENGIVLGYDNKFNPDRPLTREQMVTIIYRYAAYKGCDTSAVNGLTAFPDEGTISDYARKAFAWANSEGLIKGSDGLTQPQGTAIRAQIAAVFYRFDQFLGQEKVVTNTYDMPTNAFWSSNGGWMVDIDGTYVWAGEDGNAERVQAVEKDGAVSITSQAGKDVNLMYMQFSPENTKVSMENGRISLSIYVSDTAWLNDTWSVFEITSGENGWIGTSSLRWQINKNVITQKGWNDITLNFADAEAVGEKFDPAQFHFFLFAATNLGDGVEIRLKDLQMEEIRKETVNPSEPPAPSNPPVTPSDPPVTPSDPPVTPSEPPEESPETVTYAIAADSFGGADGKWSVWTGYEYVIMNDKGNAETYQVTLDTHDKKEGDGAIQIIASSERDTDLMYQLDEKTDTGMTKENGKLTFWLYVSDPSALGTWSAVRLASTWIEADCLTWNLNSDMVTAGWNEITLNFSDATENGTFDPSALSLFWFGVAGTKDGDIFKLDDIRISGDADTTCKHTICDVCGGCKEEGCTHTDERCATKCECEPEPECDHAFCRICGGCTVKDCDHEDERCATKCPGEGNHPRDVSFTAPTVWKYWTPEGKNHLENDVDQSEEPLGYMDGERKYLCSHGLTRVGSRLWSSFVSGDTNERQGNYVVLVTSGDNGETWSEVSVVIEHMSEKVCVVDGTLWTDPEDRLWVFWTQDYLEVPWRNYVYDENGHNYDPSDYDMFHSDALRGVWCMYSENADTATPDFSEPVRLCDGIMLNKPTVATIEGEETWLMTPYMCSWLALDDTATSETMGPTVYTLSLDDSGKPVAKFYSRIMEDPYAKIGTFRNYCEPMTVQLKDGRLMMIVRTDNGIEVVYTTDELTAAPYTGGWTTLERLRDEAGNIITRTASRTHLTKLDDGTLLLIYHNTENGSRNNMTAALSYDDGKTWPDKLLLDSRAVSYVDAVVTDDGYIYIQYDNDRYGLMELLVSRITVQDIKNGKNDELGEGSFLNKVINDNDYNKPFTYYVEGPNLLDTTGRWFGGNASSNGYKMYGSEDAKGFTSYEGGVFSVTSDGTENPTGLVYLTTDPDFINTGMTIEGGAVVFDIYVDDYTSFVNKWGVVYIGDNNDWVGTDMGNQLCWNMRNVIYQNGWNTVWLNLKDATGDKDSIDLSHIGGFWLYSNQVPSGGHIKVKNVHFVEYSATPVCKHEKCEVCDGCLVPDCDHDTGCCTPCTCPKYTYVDKYTFLIPAAASGETWVTGGRWCAGTNGSGYWWKTGHELVDKEGKKLVTYDGTEIKVTAGQVEGSHSATGLMYITASEQVINTGVTQENGRLAFDVYVTDAAEANSKGVNIEIGDVNYKTNRFHSDGNRLTWKLGALEDGWNTITLDLADAAFTASGAEGKPQTFDPTQLLYFRIYEDNMTDGHQLGVRNVKFQEKTQVTE